MRPFAALLKRAGLARPRWLLLLAVFSLTAVAPPTWAYVCQHAPAGCGCILYPWGNSLSLGVEADKFTAEQEDGIDTALGLWKSNYVAINRGFDWSFVRGDDVADWDPEDSEGQITMEDDAWFDAAGLTGGTLGVTLNDQAVNPLTCHPVGNWVSDIVLRADVDGTAVDWVDKAPTALVVDATHEEESISYVAAHELGHGIGFGHENLVPALMTGGSWGWRGYAGGNPGVGLMRLPEHDYRAMTLEMPGGSTGKNLMLSRFQQYEGNANTQEVWTTTLNVEHAAAWERVKGSTVTGANNKPLPIMIWYSGTSSIDDVVVRWTFSEDQACNDGDDVEAAEVEGIHLQSWVPNPIEMPDYTVPMALVDDGEYWLCATIDPDDEIAETSAADNWVRSERVFTALPSA